MPKLQQEQKMKLNRLRRLKVQVAQRLKERLVEEFARAHSNKPRSQEEINSYHKDLTEELRDMTLHEIIEKYKDKYKFTQVTIMHAFKSTKMCQELKKEEDSDKQTGLLSTMSGSASASHCEQPLTPPVDPKPAQIEIPPPQLIIENAQPPDFLQIRQNELIAKLGMLRRQQQIHLQCCGSLTAIIETQLQLNQERQKY